MDCGVPVDGHTPLDLRSSPCPLPTPSTSSDFAGVIQTHSFMCDKDMTDTDNKNIHKRTMDSVDGKKNPVRSHSAIHPLKRRRIEFLKEMNDSEDKKTIKPSPSDTTLPLSWTTGPPTCKQDIGSVSEGNFNTSECQCPSTSSEDIEGSSEKVYFTLGDTAGSQSNCGIQARTILENAVNMSNEDEKNVSRNCILDYITRCRFSKKSSQPQVEQKCWDYTDFKSCQMSTKAETAASVVDGSKDENVQKVSALDFLLSKFLMEKEDDTFTSRNDHANEVLEGKKKGSLNLLDVMELQVEMGLA